MTTLKGIDNPHLRDIARERREARAELDARVLAALADRTLDIEDTASALRHRYTRNVVRGSLERLERKGLLQKVAVAVGDGHRRRHWTTACADCLRPHERTGKPAPCVDHGGCLAGCGGKRRGDGDHCGPGGEDCAVADYWESA